MDLPGFRFEFGKRGERDGVGSGTVVLRSGIGGEASEGDCSATTVAMVPEAISVPTEPTVSGSCKPMNNSRTFLTDS